MEREMKMQGHLKVTTKDGEIMIEQVNGYPDESQTVFISPRQVSELIGWLQDAAKELEAQD